SEKKKPNNTLAAQLAKLTNPAPKGTKHYIQVGASKLRNNLQLTLDDAKYVGKHCTRKDIFDVVDILDQDSMKNNDFDINNRQISKMFEDQEMINDVGSSSIGSDEVNDDDKEIITEGKNDDIELNDINSIRKELVKIEDDERNLLKKMSQSAQEDINKGKHVKTQLGLWDTFLDMRIKFQKAVTISNSFPQYNMYSQFITTPDTKDLIHETKFELKELLDSLINLQKDLCINNENISISNNIVINHKRRHGNENDYLDYFWNDMQETHKNFLPYRTQTINKWNNKVQIASDDPVASGLKWAEIKKTKQKKKPVDTKASKGRKLRYHIHEKLQNFMVPIPARFCK
ncbi:15086_t:CDS:10, partial [Entrophospora sp. SA101]